MSIGQLRTILQRRQFIKVTATREHPGVPSAYRPRKLQGKNDSSVTDLYNCREATYSDDSAGQQTRENGCPDPRASLKQLGSCEDFLLVDPLAMYTSKVSR